MKFIYGDARAEFLADSSIDLIVTSPPYWQKRVYGVPGKELGQEATREEYLVNLTSIVRSWQRILKPRGSIFINLGDTVKNGALQNIPGAFALIVKKHYRLIHHIFWSKTRGMPSPARNRLKDTYEDVFQLAATDDPYLDFDAYRTRFGDDLSNVWTIPPSRTFGDHTAPFPLELVERCARLGCPPGGIIYDPFVGSGTTLEIERILEAKAVGSDLKLYENVSRLMDENKQFSLF